MFSTILQLLSWLVAAVMTVIILMASFDGTSQELNVLTQHSTFTFCVAGYVFALFLHFQGRYIRELDNKLSESVMIAARIAKKRELSE